MKKNQRALREFDQIKKLLPKLKRQAAETKSSKLWHVEAIVRQKIRQLYALSLEGEKFNHTLDDYIRLFEDVSRQILDYYNKAKRTNYSFDEVVSGNYKAYLSSGIISVLVTRHLPSLVIEQFKRLLPVNPKDEYPEARKLKRKFILHLGETNTGKTYDALMRLKAAKSGVYLAPLRILALENFERLNNEGIPCNILTGEEEIIIPGATHSSRTIEKADLNTPCEVAVIDEIQLMSDYFRGAAWTRAVLGLVAPEIHVCGARNAREHIIKMITDCGDDYELKEYTRTTPLEVIKHKVKYDSVQPGDALIAFSRRDVLGLSRYFNMKGIKNSVIYGDLPPEVRRLQYSAFLSGENRILISTDAIGMGVNLPIRRIIFTSLEKFDGNEFRVLTPQEIKQIAGRAGRIGIYDVGYVGSVYEDNSIIENGLNLPDDDINYAVVGPSEAILDIGGLPLKEKLAVWSTSAEVMEYYRKKDNRDAIIILDRLSAFPVPRQAQWRLMELPFDVHNDNLLELFMAYADEVFNKKNPSLTKPQIPSRTLADYEEFYQKVNLYYSFSKALYLDFDEEWVYSIRKKITSEINEMLL